MHCIGILKKLRTGNFSHRASSEVLKWKRKGLYVTGALLAILILSQMVYFKYRIGPDDYVRAFMIAFISLITVGLSESLVGAKKQLLFCETRHQKIFETTETAMAIIEEDTTISLVNSEYEALSGYSKVELEHQKSWVDFVQKEERGKILTYHRKNSRRNRSRPWQKS